MSLLLDVKSAVCYMLWLKEIDLTFGGFDKGVLCVSEFSL